MDLDRPRLWDYVFAWDLDTSAFAVSAAIAAVAFVAVLRARARHRPVAVAALAAGLTIATYATSGGVARYDTALFSAHAVQHLLLGMVAPALLVAAGPVRLAMRALDAPGRVRVARMLTSRTVRVVCHPAFGWLVFVATLPVLYFSPLYELSLHNDVVHGLVHAHFLVAGCLFFVHVVGRDPIARPFGFGTRILYLASTVPFHAFVGLAVVSSASLIGGRPPVTVRGVDLLADQRLGAVLLWAGAELIVGGLIAVLVWRWAAADTAVAAREDAAVLASG